MADISIIDTGYLRPTNEGTQLSDGYRAIPSNWSGLSGDIISLKGVKLNFSAKCNNDSGTEVDSSDYSTNDYASHDNPTITLSGVLDTTNSDEMKKIILMMDLCRTKGYKILFYNSNDEGADEQLLRWMGVELVGSTYTDHTFTSGEQTKFGVSAAIPHIHLRFDNFNPIHSSDSKLLRYTLVGTMDKFETSTV